MEKETICGIYKITSPTGKIYIGQSKNILKRSKSYKLLLCKRQPRVYQSIRKHGWASHVFEIVEKCEIEDLNCRERYWQDFYNVLGKKGLNCVLTFCEGVSLSEEAVKNYERRRLDNRALNKPTTAKNIINVDTLEVHYNVKDLELVTGIKVSTLRAYLNGSRPNVTRYMYLEDYQKTGITTNVGVKLKNYKNRVGEKFITNKGEKITIIKYFSALNCTIQFEDGSLKENVSYRDCKSGSILKTVNHLGETHISYQNYEMTIINFDNYSNVDIIFSDGTIIKNRQYKEVCSGSIKHPYHPSVYGIGYLGIGEYGAERNSKIYLLWSKIIKECSEFPNNIICEKWKCIQDFGHWYDNNYKEGWEFNSSISNKQNTHYSPETCWFVPKEISILFKRYNSLLPTGVYFENSSGKYVAQFKRKGRQNVRRRFNTSEKAYEFYKYHKEKYIKEVADEWKPLIEPKVYQAMYNYTVDYENIQ